MPDEKEKKEPDDENWREWPEEKLVQRVKEEAKGQRDDEEYKKVQKRAEEIGARALFRIGKMASTMRTHYRGEVLAIARDLARDLNFVPEEDEDLSTLIIILLQWDDDWEDDDKEKPDLPKVGDLVNA